MRRKRKLWLGSLLIAGVVAGGVCCFFADSLAAIFGLSRVEAATIDLLGPHLNTTGVAVPKSITNPNTSSKTNSNTNHPATATIDPTTADTPTLPTAENWSLRQTIVAREAYKASLKNTPGQQIASFSTSLAGHSASGRVMNIELASKLISGTILMPGDQFSFNQTTGDSNQPSAGWQLATVIVGDQFEQGYGGGICQVSSTLYNAVQQANLDVVERYAHSLPVGYVPPGHDATVSYPDLDFKFSNTLPVPVRIQFQVADGLVTAKLYKLPAEPQSQS